MKKVISLVLSFVMLCSLAVLPAGAEAKNIFGSEYNLIKAFDNTALAETAIGTSGYKISTDRANYNIVAVRDKKSANEGYYPYGDALAENGYYLFVGYGSSGTLTATLTLPQKVEAGKYIRITYAKPSASNGSKRSGDDKANNTNTVTIGDKKLDVQNDCSFDTWYTSNVEVSSDVTALEIKLGQWSAIAIADIEVLNADELDPDRAVEITYTLNDSPCVGLDVRVSGSGSTSYTATTYTTDENGKISLELPDGEYKLTTKKKTGLYNASENTLTVSGNISKTYTLEENTDVIIPGVYDFSKCDKNGEPIKSWTNNPATCENVDIEDTGIKLTISDTSAWTTARLIDNSEKGKNTLAPNGSPEFEGTYLFMGAGDNAKFTMKLPDTISAGKCINIKYLRPGVSNDGSSDRTAANTHTITVGDQTVNAVTACVERDKAYITSFYVAEATDTITFNFGTFAALAIERIYVSDVSEVFDFSAEDNTTFKYITPTDGTLQYTAVLYKHATRPVSGTEMTSHGDAATGADFTYSVNGYNGVIIDTNGLLTITSAAQAGEVTVSASYGGVTKNAALTLKTLGNATDVQIYGDEVIVAGATDVTKQYTAIPSAEGTAFPTRDTKWEIVGEANGASIAQDGTLTVPANTAAGVITIKATLNVSGVQTAETSDSFNVTIRTSASETAPYSVKGLLLKNGETDITKAVGIDGVIIEKTEDTSGDYDVVVKVFDENNLLIASDTESLADLTEGVQSVDVDLDFSKAVKAKLYIVTAAADEEYAIDTDNDYNIVKAEKSGSKLTRVVVMQNKNETGTDAKLIIAQYKNNALVTAAVKNVTLKKGANSIGISGVTLGDGNDVKILLWDGMDSIEPLATPLTELSEGSGAGAVAVDEVTVAATGEYKNVPLVADWITGEKSGLPMGERVTTTHGHVGVGIMSPATVPYGINPEVVDVSTENAKYTYDESYPAPSTDNALWYKKSAYTAGNNSIYARDGVDWEQKALPIGNGYMGAMLFGNPDKDQIQLNEETFWAAGYRGVQSSVNANNVNPNMSEGINGFMSVGNLFVDFHMPQNASINNYYRDLDLDNAVSHVQYEYGGTRFSREYFASYPKEVVAIRYTADKQGALSFDVNPVSMHPGEVTVNDGEITIIGKLKDSEPYDESGAAVWNQTSDLEYCTKIKVIADGGTVTDGYNTVNVKNANAVTILVTAATDYDKDRFELNADGSVNMEKTPYKSAQGVKAAIDKATRRMNGAAAMTYDTLKAEHIADYKSQFDKVKFTLTDDDEICSTPTDELQSSYSKVVSTANDADGITRVTYDQNKYDALDKHLEELHYNYARYMMISSSRSNTMPATLQGKWCQSTAEIWGSCYCININMEMNYWFAGGANLTDSTKSLIYWLKSQIPAGTVTARNYYGVTPKSYTLSGHTLTFTDSEGEKDDVFIMHTKQAIMGTTDLTGSKDIQSAGNTAWLMYNLWDLYQTTGDTGLLRDEIYPIMRKLANFYTQYLYTNEKITDGVDTEKYPDGYYYTTWEGYSPEHRKDAARKGIKYDLQLVAGMYDYTIAAAKTLGIDSDKVAAWEEIRSHLEKPVEMTDEAADKQVIKEWVDEVTYNKDANGNSLGEATHRHISHLVGLYPGTLISPDTPAELNAAKNVLINRGDDSTGWACSDRFLLWARTLEGDKALELFRYQLAKKTYSNLFDTHAPFQIDGNFGSAAGVMELLMQSQTGTVNILPALPSAWDKGEISGIKAKNGAEVSIKWADGKATEIKLIPAKDSDITIGYDKDNTLILGGEEVTFTGGRYTITNAKKGTTYTFTAK